MLASTVKFSTYGRVPDPTTSSRGGKHRSAEVPVAVQPTLQDPTACLGRAAHPSGFPLLPKQVVLTNAYTSRLNGQCSTFQSCSDHERMSWNRGIPTSKLAALLLRKEVIQPHLPVRLPCYDLVLIASPTFDGSLHKGLGHRLRVLPTFMT